VIDTNNVTNFQPQNVAIAYNNQCTSCLTFAYANQYVIQVDHPVWLSHDGPEQASEIQEQINGGAASSEDFGTMSSQLDQLSQELYNLVFNDTQQQHGGHHGGAERRTAPSGPDPPGRATRKPLELRGAPAHDRRS
jgi:putative peptide zinc metalloprotease protein